MHSDELHNSTDSGSASLLPYRRLYSQYCSGSYGPISMDTALDNAMMVYCTAIRLGDQELENDLKGLAVVATDPSRPFDKVEILGTQRAQQCVC